MGIDASRRREFGWRIADVLAPIALGLLLVTSSARVAAGSTWLHERLFERHNVAAETGLSFDAVRGVNGQIQDYFTSDAEPLSVTATLYGTTETALFDEAEVAHMADVKQLLLRTYRVQGASALFLLLIFALGVVLFRRGAAVSAAAWLRHGAIGTAAVILVLGVASVVAFGPVFRLFHLIGFPQGNFTFNASTSYLVRIYPASFFQDMALTIGGLTLAGAALAWLAGRTYGKRANAAAGRKPSPPATPRG